MARDSEYKEIPPNNDLQKRKEYWEIAKGLQKTDGLETSAYLESIIADTVSGKYGTESAKKKVLKYYAEIDVHSPEYKTKEADVVATRITAYLETSDFKFAPIMLNSIHRNLFQDILPYKWVGVYRTVNISKEEDVLQGESVQYADWNSIREYLAYDFEEEKKVRYQLPFTSEQAKMFAEFISRIWQTHPFREGNTRTVSTFLIKYLRHLGIEINNDPFKHHAKWFRDALVLSNYSNIPNGIYPDFSYLVMFFENILMDVGHELHSFDLCRKKPHEKG